MSNIILQTVINNNLDYISISANENYDIEFKLFDKNNILLSNNKIFNFIFQTLSEAYISGLKHKIDTLFDGYHFGFDLIDKQCILYLDNNIIEIEEKYENDFCIILDIANKYLGEVNNDIK